MKHLLVLMSALAVLASCGPGRDAIAFDGEYFRTNVSKVDGAREVFTVRIRDISRSPEGALEAGRHAGNAYCIENFGSSDIDWTVGPDTPLEEVPVSDDTIVLQGVCPQL